MVFFVCMYIFSIFSLPLSFCVLVYALYPATERREAGGMWLRGFAISLPLVFVARAAGALVPSMYGTILSPLHEAADRFLPFILIPGAVYTLFRHRLGVAADGPARRRLTAFYSGALSLSGCSEVFHTVEAPSVFVLFALPFLTFSIMIAAPRLWAGFDRAVLHPHPRQPFLRIPVRGRAVNDAYGRIVDLIRGLTFTARMRLWFYCAGICLAASLVPGFFRHRLWFLAWPLTAGITALSWAIALPGLNARE